jgi:hypothetical protein
MCALEKDQPDAHVFGWRENSRRQGGLTQGGRSVGLAACAHERARVRACTKVCVCACGVRTCLNRTCEQHKAAAKWRLGVTAQGERWWLGHDGERGNNTQGEPQVNRRARLPQGGQGGRKRPDRGCILSSRTRARGGGAETRCARWRTEHRYGQAGVCVHGDEGNGTYKWPTWLDGPLTIDGGSRGGAEQHGFVHEHTRPTNTQGSIGNHSSKFGHHIRGKWQWSPRGCKDGNGSRRRRGAAAEQAWSRRSRGAGPAPDDGLQQLPRADSVFAVTSTNGLPRLPLFLFPLCQRRRKWGGIPGWLGLEAAVVI